MAYRKKALLERTWNADTACSTVKSHFALDGVKDWHGAQNDDALPSKLLRQAGVMGGHDMMLCHFRSAMVE